MFCSVLSTSIFVEIIFWIRAFERKTIVRVLPKYDFFMPTIDSHEKQSRLMELWKILVIENIIKK